MIHGGFNGKNHRKTLEKYGEILYRWWIFQQAVFDDTGFFITSQEK
jgi:hypothetical protein